MGEMGISVVALLSLLPLLVVVAVQNLVFNRASLKLLSVVLHNQLLR